MDPVCMGVLRSEKLRLRLRIQLVFSFRTITDKRHKMRLFETHKIVTTCHGNSGPMIQATHFWVHLMKNILFYPILTSEHLHPPHSCIVDVIFNLFPINQMIYALSCVLPGLCQSHYTPVQCPGCSTSCIVDSVILLSQ